MLLKSISGINIEVWFQLLNIKLNTIACFLCDIVTEFICIYRIGACDTIMLKQDNIITKKAWEGANKQVISSQADSLIKISRIWADFFPANTSNQPI